MCFIRTGLVNPFFWKSAGSYWQIAMPELDTLQGLVTSVSSTPPWHLVTPTVDLSLSTLSKSVTSPEIYLSKFLEICEGLLDYYHIYTDGSKMNNLTAAAAVGQDDSKSLRINSHASIFTVEIVALNLSLDIIRRSKCKKCAIFSDSLSSLLAINNRHLDTGYVQRNEIYHRLQPVIKLWKDHHSNLDSKPYWY